MGLTFAEVELNGAKFKALVDTGINGDVLVRRDEAERLGLRPIGKSTRRTVDNRVIETEVSYAKLRLFDSEGYVFVEIIEDMPLEVLVSVRALEALGYVVDPATGILRKVGLLAV